MTASTARSPIPSLGDEGIQELQGQSPRRSTASQARALLSPRRRWKLEFTGENLIDHTPRDETVRVYTGDAFDLVGERRRTAYDIDTNRNWLDESFEIKLRNRKEDGAVEIRVVEHLYRGSVGRSSRNPTRSQDRQPDHRVPRPGPAGEERIVTYKAHYTCEIPVHPILTRLDITWWHRQTQFGDGFAGDCHRLQ